MSFQINTNVSGLNAQAQSSYTNRMLSSSLEKLSSGLRINKAADDASGMAIADSLRSQANALGQAIKNANDGNSIVQIADKAMDEQIKILDTIKTKAVQAAQDGQTEDTRKAIQADITRLIESLDNIAAQTSYNGQNLLSGAYTNKSFQIGAYTNQTVGMSIDSTSSAKIGHARFETTDDLTTGGVAQLTFNSVDGKRNVTIQDVVVSNSAGTGIGVLADQINANSDQLGVKASWQNQMTGNTAVASGSIQGLTINNITIGDIDVQDMDSDGALVKAINQESSKTGVQASIDEEGQLNLNSLDGRGIHISGTNLNAVSILGADSNTFYGRLTLTSLGSQDIDVTDAGGTSIDTSANEATVNLRDVKNDFTVAESTAMGAYANANQVTDAGTNGLSNGVMTKAGAMAVMEIADSALKQLDAIRSDLGSVQNQFTATINNISVTQVNVQAAESGIRNLDFSAESMNFSKMNILAQSGVYALAQSQSVQQNVLRLLQ